MFRYHGSWSSMLTWSRWFQRSGCRNESCNRLWMCQCRRSRSRLLEWSWWFCRSSASECVFFSFDSVWEGGCGRQQWHSRLPPMRRIESDIRWQRPCMMAAFTASRHFMATLGAPRPRRSGRNGNCSFFTLDMVFVKGDVSWTNVSHDKRHTTTETEPYPTWSVRTSREQHVPDSIACTQNRVKWSMRRQSLLSQFWRMSTWAPPRSGACGSVCFNTGKLTRFWHCKDWQIDSSFLIPRVVPRGRSQLVESFVWLIPFLCVKRKRRERMKEKRREKKREDERENEER